MSKTSPFKEKTLRILGIHLGGANTHKSAMVRASMRVSTIFSGLPENGGHAEFKRVMENLFPYVPVVSSSALENRTLPRPPVLWEAYCLNVGATPSMDSDSRLLQAVADLGGADVVIIDAPLTLPPCVTCPLVCPGTENCIVPSVAGMREEWNLRRKMDRRTRMPQPYVDRFFEVHIRNVTDSHSALGGYEFEAALGSGRAPLTARAIRMAREIESKFPGTVVLEGNAFAAAMGWSLRAGMRVSRMDDFRSGPESSALRRAFFHELEKKQIALRSASLHEELHEELITHLDAFHASLSVLGVWSLLNGEAYVSREFLNLDPTWPLRGWACIPRDIVQYAWSE